MLWFGANMQITAVVDGALAVIFGTEALTATVGLLIGNLFGGAVMALHSAQGPRLGLPQMISSRAQFGVKGAAFPLVLVILMYLGFAATSAVLSGQAIYKGAVSAALGGADVSWIVGLVVTAAVYYPLAKRSARVPARMIYPGEANDAGVPATVRRSSR